jgi:hypothetical protein
MDPSGLTLLIREDCELCEQMRAELAQLAAVIQLPVLRLQDVDGDPELQRRYGLKVPVLLLDGQLVAATHLDRADLARLLARRDHSSGPAI